jgi:hypothetical protein
MTYDKANCERLAGLIVLSGIISAAPVASANNSSAIVGGQDIWKVVAHSAGTTGIGKDSVCGKCASQGMCGSAYMNKHRHQAQAHSTTHKWVQSRRAAPSPSKHAA